MNMSLFDQVVNESYSADLGADVETQALDATEESYIDGIITDDPVTMFSYTGECTNAIMALEAAEARMEGMMAVKLMNARQAGDEAAMEATVVTMEGFVGNVWEALKELIQKAYTAIKNFLIKVWNKFKGYGNVVKAFFTKYGDVLRHKAVPGLMVKWERIDLDGAMTVYNNFVRTIEHNMSRLTSGQGIAKAVNGVTDAIGGSANAWKHDSNVRRSMQPNASLDAAGGLPTPHEINTALEREIYPDRSRTSDPEHEEPFERVRSDAIEAADISSYKKYIDNFLALGNKGNKELLKAVEDAKKQLARNRAGDQASGTGSFNSALRRCCNAQIELHRLCVHAMSNAAKRMQSQSIAACRKAIMFHATEGNGATYAGESTTAPADQYFDNIMGSLLG